MQINATTADFVAISATADFVATIPPCDCQKQIGKHTHIHAQVMLLINLSLDKTSAAVRETRRVERLLVPIWCRVSACEVSRTRSLIETMGRMPVSVGIADSACGRPPSHSLRRYINVACVYISVMTVCVRAISLVAGLRLCCLDAVLSFSGRAASSTLSSRAHLHWRQPTTIAAGNN